MPSSEECATLQGKRDFVGVIKDLEMRRLSWSIQCPPHPPHHHNGPYKGKREGQVRVRKIEDITLLS